MDEQLPIAMRPECPIVSVNQDRLFRRKFIQRLIRAVIDPDKKMATGVTIGITGPWGSGKTSILNLMHEEIVSQYENSLVVRFDPWLVSGRDIIINQFLSELMGSINSNAKLKEKLSGPLKTLEEYSDKLAPIVNIKLPGVGTVIRYGMKVLKSSLSNESSLHQLRSRLLKELSAINVPIVVMIDELDRIEDEEVKAVAQLVRSVADFPNVSYVLAYDSERVIQALGRGTSGNEKEYGRAYLEKIVQLQIPLPVSLDNEIRELLIAEIEGLALNLFLKDGWKEEQDFKQLLEIIVPGVISTPRDIQRLVGTFHVLEGMVRGEVHWVDLLGYAVLLVKAPTTAENIKRHPDAVVENPITMEAEFERFSSEKISASERLDRINPEKEGGPSVKKLLQFLFPTFIENPDKSVSHSVQRAVQVGPELICYRQRLLTVLRHDIIPGAFSQNEITSILNRSSMEVADVLQQIYQNNRFGEFIDRLGEVYPQASSIYHGEFWLGVGMFLMRKDQKWLATYSPMQEITAALGKTFYSMATEIENFRAVALEVVSRLVQISDSSLAPFVLRRHIHAHGLFGWRKQGDDKSPFLTISETENLIRSQAATFRDKHLTEDWLATLWVLSSVYNMVDAGMWDEKCRKRLDELLEKPEALDGFSLLLYGGAFIRDQKDLEKIMDKELYLRRVRERLTSNNIDASVRTAFQKALGEW